MMLCCMVSSNLSYGIPWQRFSRIGSFDWLGSENRQKMIALSRERNIDYS